MPRLIARSRRGASNARDDGSSPFRMLPTLSELRLIVDLLDERGGSPARVLAFQARLQHLLDGLH